MGNVEIAHVDGDDKEYAVVIKDEDKAYFAECHSDGSTLIVDGDAFWSTLDGVELTRGHYRSVQPSIAT